MNLNWMYFSKEGRISRRQFWLYGALAYLPFYILLHMIAAMSNSPQTADAIILIGTLLLLYPMLMVQAKRWHDRGKSGWWWLISFLPIVGGIWAFIELGILPGDKDKNDYGSPPTLVKLAPGTAEA